MRQDEEGSQVMNRHFENVHSHQLIRPGNRRMFITSIGRNNFTDSICINMKFGFPCLSNCVENFQIIYNADNTDIYQTPREKLQFCAKKYFKTSELLGNINRC